jgi:GNAT superfamily N-acetyltransferase
MAAFRVRRFADPDLAACLAISNAIDVAHPVGLTEAQRNYESWNAERYYRRRLVAEGEGEGVVGWGEIAHNPWQFHPRKYDLHMEVHPRHRRQGIGDQLLGQLLAHLRTRDALLVRAIATEDDPETVGFLTHRGFREVWRNLASRLDLAQFDPREFASASERTEKQGVVITTLAAEIEHDPAVLREYYELAAIGDRDQPQLDPVTPPDFEEYVANVINGPNALLESWFVARAGRRLVGLSTLELLDGSPGELEAGYTAVHPDYRGRGIAIALKLKTIDFAREHSYRYINTDSNAVNERMLNINAALGFQPQPARVTFELTPIATTS